VAAAAPAERPPAAMVAPAAHAPLAAVPAPVPVGGRPLVSCIMPTANRRLFAPQAIRYFQRQDYPEQELIILDDGEQDIGDLVPVDPRVCSERLDRRATIGAKNNLACALARGEVIVHWDDDDWMADWRLSYQVEAVLPHSSRTLCGLSRLYFFDPGSDQAWQY